MPQPKKSSGSSKSSGRSESAAKRPKARKEAPVKAAREASNGEHAREPRAASTSATYSTEPAEASAAMQRAEDVVDEAGRKVGAFVSEWSMRIRRAAAMAREEAEDMWAEAQSIRRGEIE